MILNFWTYFVVVWLWGRVIALVDLPICQTLFHLQQQEIGATSSWISKPTKSHLGECCWSLPPGGAFMGQAVWDYKFSFILQKTQVSLPKGSHLISDAKKNLFNTNITQIWSKFNIMTEGINTAIYCYKGIQLSKSPAGIFCKQVHLISWR